MKVVHNLRKLNLDPNKKAYICDVCSRVFNWDENSGWYGSFEDLDQNPQRVTVVCSEKCKSQSPNS